MPRAPRKGVPKKRMPAREDNMLPLLLLLLWWCWFLPKDSLAFRIAFRTTNPPKHCAIIIRGLSGHFYSEKKNVTFIINPLQKRIKKKGIIPSSPSPPQFQTSPQYSSSSSESPLVQTTPIDNHIAKFSLEEVFGVTFCYRIANLSIFLLLFLLSLSLSLRE